MSTDKRALNNQDKVHDFKKYKSKKESKYMLPFNSSMNSNSLKYSNKNNIKSNLDAENLQKSQLNEELQN